MKEKKIKKYLKNKEVAMYIALDMILKKDKNFLPPEVVYIFNEKLIDFIKIFENKVIKIPSYIDFKFMLECSSYFYFCNKEKMPEAEFQRTSKIADSYFQKIKDHCAKWYDSLSADEKETYNDLIL